MKWKMPACSAYVRHAECKLSCHWAVSWQFSQSEATSVRTSIHSTGWHWDPLSLLTLTSPLMHRPMLQLGLGVGDVKIRGTRKSFFKRATSGDRTDQLGRRWPVIVGCCSWSLSPETVVEWFQVKRKSDNISGKKQKENIITNWYGRIPTFWQNNNKKKSNGSHYNTGIN